MKNYLSNGLRFVLPLATVVACLVIAPSAHAQIKVEVGEDVKVPYLGDWHDGVVVDIDKKNKKRLLIEFIWAEKFRRDVFDRRQIRKLYEFRAMDFGREWASVSGEFKIEASLFRVPNDTEVVLLTPEEKEVTVELEKLSTRDKNYVKKFVKNFKNSVRRGMIPDVTPALPEIESMSGGMGSTIPTMASGDLTPLGSIPKYLKEFKQSGTGYNLIRKDSKLIAVIPVGGPDQLVLMSFRERNPFKSGERFQSQLYWVSMKTKKVVNFVSITHEDYAIDYDPRYNLLLTFNRNEEFIGQVDEPDHYTIWKMTPGGDTAEPLMRFEGQGLDWHESLFGKIITDQIVLVKSKRQEYQAYDFAEKQVLYTIRPESFFDAPVVISHDRKYLIMPEDGRVSVADTLTGEIKFSVLVDDRHVSGANINEDGTKLAALTERNIYVWDLNTVDKTPKVYPAPLMASPFSSRIEWIDNDHILGQSHRNRILYRLSLGLPVWSYEMDVRQYFLNRDPLKNMVIDGKFFYVARPDVWGASIAVGAVSMPGPGVAEVTANVDRNSLLLMKQGATVSIDTSGTSDPQRVEAALMKQIKKNGWVYDSEAEVYLEATTGIGQNQTIEYQELGGGKVHSVSFRPHFANLKLKRGQTILWQTGSRSGAPGFLRGKNLQSQIDSYQTPQIAFFERVKIDPEIIDPKYSRGFGVSKLGLRGIEVISTTPPGREDDPFAASKKADEDERKAAEEDGKQKEGGDKGGESSGTGGALGQPGRGGR